MSNLYARANSRQERVLRIVEGAVINAGHAHPAKAVDARMARSIAKRATGTLTAAWPDVLATPMALSEKPKVALLTADGARAASVRPGRGAGLLCDGRTGPVRFLHGRIGSLAAGAKKCGDTVRYTALTDTLREIGAILKLLEAAQ